MQTYNDGMKKIHVGYVTSMALALLIGSALPGAAAWVSAHGGDANLIHGCVKNLNGSIRIVGDNDTCNNGETPLDWNQKNTPGLGGLIEDTTGADFTYVDLRYRNLKGRDFSGSDLSNSNFAHANLNAVNLTNGTFTATNFNGAKLNNVIITGATFSGVDVRNVDLSGQNWSGASITAMNFTGSNLSGFTYSGKPESVSNSFEGTNLTNANLSNTPFHSSGFNGANFTNANLSGTDFSASQLTGANATNANFNGADLRNTYRSDVVWNNTTCPDGTNSNSNGNTCEGHLQI